MTSVPMPVPGSRRRILKGALGLAAASFAAPSFANVVQPHRLRLWMEGDIDLAWVHSLFVPPELAAGLPPGLVARLRVECPATAGRAARERATTVLYVFAAPAGVAPGVPAPEAFPISRLHMVAESVLLSVAEFSDPDTRPAKNLVIYMLATFLALRMVMARSSVMAAGPMQGAFIIQIGYAIVTWLIAALVVEYQGRRDAQSGEVVLHVADEIEIGIAAGRIEPDEGSYPVEAGGPAAAHRRDSAAASRSEAA